MTYNLTQRVTRAAATVLNVPLNATGTQVLHQLAELTNIQARYWERNLVTAPNPIQPGQPDSLVTARQIAAAKVLFTTGNLRTRAVLDFLKVDYAFPEWERLFPPPITVGETQQPSLLAG